jgi:hypothetical protein
MGRNVRRESGGGFGGSPTTVRGSRVRENGAAQVGFALSVALSETIFPHENALNGQISNHFFDTIGHFFELSSSAPAPHPQFSLQPRLLSDPIKSSAKKSVQG